VVDVFLSYKSEERPLVEPLNTCLFSLKPDVFFDVERLESDDYWSNVIDKAVRTARAVVGCWSPSAHQSPWVQKECLLAREFGTLIPAMILPYEERQVFIEFVRTQRRDLIGFDGGWSHPGFNFLLRDIGEKVGREGLVDFAQVMARGDVAEAAAWAGRLPDDPLADEAVDMAYRERPRLRHPVPPHSPPASRLARSPARPTPALEHEDAWMAIEHSLDAAHYRRFERTFELNPAAFKHVVEAEARAKVLESWAAIDKSDAAVIAEMVRTGLFPALETKAREAMDLIAQAREMARLSKRQTSERLASLARAAALLKNPIPERTFRIELPDVSDWPRPEMIAIPPGEFLMGSPASEERWDSYDGSEEPQHEVKIGYVFFVGKTAVTVKELSSFVAETGYDTGTSSLAWHVNEWREFRGMGWGRPGFLQTVKHPVTCVSWNDAQAYLGWLNRKLGLEERADCYRLLSESEWEYACRSGTATPFSCGQTISTAQANYYGQHTYGEGKKGNYRQKTTPAGLFKANDFGLCDMHGAVWEWCEDVWHDSYAEPDRPDDGSPWLNGQTSRRVLRGGSWFSPPHLLRSAHRGWYDPSMRNHTVGFRLGRTVLPT